MTLPRMIACDLDGTLLRTDHTVSDRTIAALTAVRAAGIPFVVVTGRPVRWLGVVLDRIGRCTEVISGNGARILDADGADLISWPIEARTLTTITDLLRAELGDVSFAVERADGTGMVKEHAYQVDVRLSQPPSVTLPELVREPALKLLVSLDGANGDDLMARCQTLLKGLATATHSSLSSGLIEVSGDGVTKGAALGWLAARYQVLPADVLAFGDMPNDLSMLGWAGHSVAVANAHPAVKETADEITASNDEDGVAAVLERLLAEM